MQKVEVHSTMPGDLRRKSLAGWLLEIWKSRAMLREGRERRMQLLETLPVGGKRQLMLVRCGDEHFMVGGGVESISTIVKVSGDESELCR
jgi:flagellar biogenesis protein FliO